MSKYIVTQYDVGETEVEATFFKIELGNLLFFKAGSSQPLAAFNTWINVVKADEQ